MPQDPHLRGFVIHLIAYVTVNIALAVLNLLRTPDNIWFIWPLAGWGIGVAAHGLALYLRRRGPRAGPLADPDMRGLAVHAFAYVAVNGLLILVDLTTSPGAQWFYWPLLGWGAGLAAHGVLVWRTVRRGRAGAAGSQRA